MTSLVAMLRMDRGRLTALPAASGSSTKPHMEVRRFFLRPKTKFAACLLYSCLPAVFFPTPDLVARAVLIDMEPKVINHSMSMAAKSGRWRYGESSHFSQKQGSGNNWANG